MPVSQGVNKRLSFKKQTALGTPAVGSGAQYLRRESAALNFSKDSFEANEITSHQQDTGKTYGVGSGKGSLKGVLSAGTYPLAIASIMRKDMTATAAATGLSVTIAGAGPYTLTRSAGDFLAGGFKIGDVVRITAGTYTGTARDINLICTGVTATVLTVVVANGATLTAQGPIATSTIAVIGKKSIVPTSGHTNDYYSLEEWYSDISKSRLYTDAQFSSADISIPASGNTSIGLDLVALGRTKGTAQAQTSPTVETTSTILSSSNGYIMLAGTKLVVATSISIKIDGQVALGEAVVGSRNIADVYRGDVMVTGSISLVHDSETVSDYFVNETALSVVAVVFADNTATSEFVSFVLPRVKLFGDDIDDGKKQLVSTYPYTAEFNGTGGAALASDQTIFSMQDSNA